MIFVNFGQIGTLRSKMLKKILQNGYELAKMAQNDQIFVNQTLKTGYELAKMAQNDQTLKTPYFLVFNVLLHFSTKKVEKNTSFK